MCSRIDASDQPKMMLLMLRIRCRFAASDGSAWHTVSHMQGAFGYRWHSRCRRHIAAVRSVFGGTTPH